MHNGRRGKRRNRKKIRSRKCKRGSRCMRTIGNKRFNQNRSGQEKILIKNLKRRWTK